MISKLRRANAAELTRVQGHAAYNSNTDAAGDTAHQAVPHAWYLPDVLEVIDRESLP